MKAQIRSLQVFRGLAAMAVVAHHAALSTEAFIGHMPEALSLLFSFGLLGVDFFFVLSGFIIMHAHMEDDRTGTTLKRYAAKRVTRIFPAYWPVGAGMIALYEALPNLSAGNERNYSMISSLLLLPGNGVPALSVAWTLIHELMFYGVFLLLFIGRRWRVAGLLAWAILIVVVNQLTAPTGWLRYPLSLLNIEFMLGVGAAWLLRKHAHQWNGLALVAAGSALTGVALWLMAPAKDEYLRLLLAVGLALLIVGFAVHEQSNSLQWAAPFSLIGNASYSIYLIHNPLLSVTQRIASAMALEWLGAMAWGVVLSGLAGWVYYRLVETPAGRFFQSRLRSQ